MRLSCASLRLEECDRVTVCYRPATSVPLTYGEPLEVPDALYAQVGELHIFGRPAVMVELLSKALSECLLPGATGAWMDRAMTQTIPVRLPTNHPCPPWLALRCSRPRCQGWPEATAIAACP